MQQELLTISFGVSKMFIEITIKDYSGAKLDFFKWDLKDKDLERRIFYVIKNKYGVFQVEKKDRDLDWAKDN